MVWWPMLSHITYEKHEGTVYFLWKPESYKESYEIDIC